MEDNNSTEATFHKSVSYAIGLIFVGAVDYALYFTEDRNYRTVLLRFLDQLFGAFVAAVTYRVLKWSFDRWYPISEDINSPKFVSGSALPDRELRLCVRSVISS